MSMQAQDDHYGDPRAVAAAFADVVREEVQDLFAAGADIVQLDEPWMESRAEQAREFGVDTLHRALDGVDGTTALHICFGYPLFVPGHARRYRFLAELADAPVDQISIETAQAQLDLEVLSQLSGKTIILGVIALDSDEVEERRHGGRADPARAALHAGSDRRPGLRDEVPHARGGVRQAAVAGRGRAGRLSRAGVTRSRRPR